MAQAAIPVIATAFSVAGKVQEGRAIKKQRDSEARQLDANARRRLEQGESLAQEEARRTARLASDASAVMGGSGFSGSDAQALQQLGKIDGMGKYNELSYLYEAEMDATGMRRQAQNARDSGKRARNAAYLSAASTAISGLASSGMFNKKPMTGTNAGPYRSGYRPNPGFPSGPKPQYNPFNVRVR